MLVALGKTSLSKRTVLLYVNLRIVTSLSHWRTVAGDADLETGASTPDAASGRHQSSGSPRGAPQYNTNTPNQTPGPRKLKTCGGE